MPKHQLPTSTKFRMFKSIAKAQISNSYKVQNVQKTYNMPAMYEYDSSMMYSISEYDYHYKNHKRLPKMDI